MMQLVVTWSVAAGLLGLSPATLQAHPLASPSEPEVPALVETGAPLWSACRPELTSGDPAPGAPRHEGRADSRKGAAASSGHGAAPREVAPAEAGVAETPVPASWLPCVPWGPGLTGPSASSMGSGGDDEEVPICVDGAECSPVSPKHAPYSVSFTPAKAVIVPAALPPLAPLRSGRFPRSLGAAAAGFPLCPFEPPRAVVPG